VWLVQTCHVGVDCSSVCVLFFEWNERYLYAVLGSYT